MRCFRCNSIIVDKYYEANGQKYCFSCQDNTYVEGLQGHACCNCSKPADKYILGNWYCGECTSTMFLGD